MYNVLLGIDIILALFLCALVMLQRSDGGALGGLGGGTGSSFMTGRSVDKSNCDYCIFLFCNQFGFKRLGKTKCKTG